MIKFIWFIHRPLEDVEGFERWYQDEHVPIGMRQELLHRFRISRSLYPQPAFVARAMGTDEPRAFRFSEAWWRSVADAERCYTLPNGLAALADRSDGPLNQWPVVAPERRAVVILQEEPLPVARALAFDVRAGRYRAEHARRLFGFLRLKPGAATPFDTGYRALAVEAATDPDLRGHTLGRELDAVIRIRRKAQLPPAGIERFQRVLEFEFESQDALERFCASPHMDRVAALTAETCDAVVWDAVEMQEVLYSVTGDQPLEPAWTALYAG